MNQREILEYFETRNDAMIEMIGEIVDLESPSHDAARSRVVVDWIVRQFVETRIPASIERVPVADGEHVIIRAFPGEGKHTLLLGHTDTVHPVGAKLQNPTRIDGDRYYGCGIFDMKANTVLIIEAFRFFATSGSRPVRPITILLSCDEEVGSHTGRALVERESQNAEHCLVLEPSSDGKVKTGRKGTGMFTLRTHGLPAHAGLEPEKGASAILELSRQIEHIHGVARPDVGTTVNVCTIKGGTASNVIPEHAECEIDVRFSTVAEAERVDGEIRDLQAFDKRVTLELLGGINRPPLERTDAVVALYEKAKTLAAGFDYELGETQVGGASDGNFVGSMGVPVLDGLGIAGAGAHMLTEHILVSDIAKRAALVTSLLTTD